MDKDGIFGAFTDPTMSSQMFDALADKTDMFNDPMGSETLGAVNRAIVGTPIDAVDLMGRVGETALRGAAKAGEGIIGALGSDEGMAKRFGRDIYGLGIAASTLAPMAGPRPRGKSNKALVLEAQKDKVKSPVAKQKLDEDMDFEAIDDALKDADLDLDEALSVQSNVSATERTLDTSDFSDILQNEFAIARDSGKSRGEAMADAMRNTEKAMSDMNMMDVVIDRPIQDKIFKRLDDDYEFGVSKAIKRREEATANQSALRSQANQARMANQPRVSVEDAVRQQQELINFGIPEPTTQKPTLVTIEGGKD
jgi:hypothetical protein